MLNPALLIFILGAFLSLFIMPAFADENRWKPNWLSVSDSVALEKTWVSAYVALPDPLGSRSGKLLQNEALLNGQIAKSYDHKKLPLILFLHACEGLGHHRDDIARFARLGFAVIAIDSFARDHRPLGCNEEKERYIRYYDIAVAFQKAELDYAVERIKNLPWVDRNFQFLVGSGIGGMVVAHYQGADFSGHVIEGWGCRHANPVFDGIWAPPGVRIFSVVSKIDRWYKNVPGFGIDCGRYLKNRPNSIAIELNRPAHYVSWYPGSRTALIRFLTHGMELNQKALIDDTPDTIHADQTGIKLRVKWSVDAVYRAAQKHCAIHGRKNHLINNSEQGIYQFVCS